MSHCVNEIIPICILSVAAEGINRGFCLTWIPIGIMGNTLSFLVNVLNLADMYLLQFLSLPIELKKNNIILHEDGNITGATFWRALIFQYT